MKKAIITGGTKGFGLAYKNILDAQGFSTLTVARKGSDNNIDLSNLEGTEKLIKMIEVEKPNLVILNAGFGGTKPFEEYTPKDIMDMQHINGTGKAIIVNHFFDEIKGSKIKFIVASSIAGKVPSPLMASYSASKAYASNLIDSINGELFSQGIENLVIDATPGNVNTKSQTQEVVNYANKVLRSKGGTVFNNDIYYEVMSRPHENWCKFVKNSYERKKERINDRK